MTDTAIRPATSDDLDAITAIYADAVLNGTASYELEPPDRAEMAGRFETLQKGGFPYLVAGQKDRVLGYAYAGPFRPRPAYRFMVENSVYVDPAAQGQGIGRLLLAALIEECARLGFRQIVAVIGDGANHRASVRLHEALGFENAGTIRGSGYKFDRWLDTLFMQLALNKGSAAPPDPRSLPERTFRDGR